MSLQETLHQEHVMRRKRWSEASMVRHLRGVEEAVCDLHVMVAGNLAAMSTPVEPSAIDGGRPATEVPTKHRPTVLDIQTATATEFRVRVLDILSARRTNDVVLPRQVAMYLCKRHTLRSLPQIGRQFGGRDHTTIIHGVRKIDGMMADDADFKERIEALKARLAECFVME
jgi:chromosomal replication initiator protein